MIRKVFSKIRNATSNMTFLWLVYHLTGSLLKMTVTGILERLLPLILVPLIRPCLNRSSESRAMVAIDEVRAGLLLPLLTFFPLGCVSLGWLHLSAFAPATERGAAK